MSGFFPATIPGGRSRAILSGAAAVSLLLIAGCMSQVSYQPAERVAETAGTADAKKRISELLLRAREPHVTSVRPTDDYLQYFWERMAPETIINPVYVANVAEIHYSSVSQIEVYDNNWVFVWGPQKESVEKVNFSSQEDARAFADLVSSFRTLAKSSVFPPRPPQGGGIPAGPVPASVPKGQTDSAKPVKATTRS